MKTHFLEISEARKQLTKLGKELQIDSIIIVTRHGKKIFAIVHLDYLSMINETFEILSDPEAIQMLQESLKDIFAGRIHTHEKVKKELF